MSHHDADDAARSGALEPARAHVLADCVRYADGSIVSRTVHDTGSGTITLFAFDAGQTLSEHTTPYDAYVCVLDGAAELTIGGETVEAESGQVVLMPAEVPHAVGAPERFKMMLVMIRD
jgi:quercetin dioxygenase-like cupin family protein